MIHHTHCSLRLGDNLQHLQFLRGLAKANPQHHFRHAAHTGYLPQMIEVVADIPNITLATLESKAVESMEVWKNHDGYWENHPNRHDYVGFYLEFFRRLAAEMGLQTEMRTAADFLFDYPALKQEFGKPFDFLVVNSPPMSNQAQGYDRTEMLTLISSLVAAKRSVVCTHRVPIPGVAYTQDHGLTVTGIGALSRVCKYIVMVSTGPSWPTFNIWTNETCALRVIIIDDDRVGIGRNAEQVKTFRAAQALLVEKGIL
jgi:hypothetical protein